MEDGFKDYVLKNVQRIAHKVIRDLRTIPHADHFHGFLLIDRDAFNVIIKEIALHFWDECKSTADSKGIGNDETAVAQLLWGYVFYKLLETLPEGFDNLEDLVSTYSQASAVWFVGAGVSLDARTGWLSVKESLRHCLMNGISQNDFEDEWARDNEGGDLWKNLRGNTKIEKKFKDTFAGHVRTVISSPKGPADSHKDIANLWNSSLIEHLICFNWDNYIEHSMGQQIEICYGDDPVAPGTKVCFWKPCGCVSQPHKTWIYPDQQDIILNPHLCEEIEKASKPRIGIVVGFSGTQRFGKEEIEECLGTGVKTYDIRPQIWCERDLGEKPVKCGALYAISFMAEKV